MSLEVGTTLSTGDVVQVILTGGFSEVALLTSETQGKRALKRLRDDVLEAGGAEVRRQFVRECNTWCTRLSDAPSVARAYFAFDNLDSLGPVLFLEWVDGKSLRELLTASPRLSMTETALIGMQIGQALGFAHAKDVRHRDLKPGNVLISSANEVRVIDWGLCSVPGAAGLDALTPEYASPERQTDPALDDPADDVYSLGNMLYRCLTGEVAQAGADAKVVRGRLLDKEPMLPEKFAELVASCLTDDPTKRPKAVGLVEALEQLLGEIEKCEIEFPFCPRCGCVARDDGGNGCTACGGHLRRRVARQTRSGMVRIAAGPFTTGLTRDQAKIALTASGIQPDADNVGHLVSDVARVFLPAFDIDVYPVTNKEFDEFCRKCNYPEPDGFAARKLAFPNHPVVNVTWKDALCYCLWSRKRLPLPLEWQKAARGMSDRRSYPWGDVWDADRCNHSQSLLYRNTTPVDAFESDSMDGTSPFGVADMAGNVKEWLAEGKQFGLRGLAGCGWNERGQVYGLVPMARDADVDFSDTSTGFRCAADVEYDEEDVR